MMKNILIILTVVAIIAAISKPGEEHHKEYLKIKLSHKLREVTSNHNGGFWAKAGELLGNTAGDWGIEAFVDNQIKVEDYWLFSVSTYHLNGQTKTIGIGAFGRVIIVSDLNL